MESFAAGVDCHKDTHTVVILDAHGKVVRELVIQANDAGYAHAIATAEQLGRVVFGLEGTGHYGRGFARALIASDITVFEVPGLLTKRHRGRASRKGKSDRNDAHAVAEVVLRDAERLPAFRERDEQEALKAQYDQRDRLVRERSASVNRLRSNAFRLGIETARDLTSARALQRLATAVEQAKLETLRDRVLLDEMQFDIESVERLSKRIVQLERDMRPFVRPLAPELLAMYGVSTVVAAGLVGHAGDMRNLRDASAFAMRSATAPVCCSSGRHQAVRLNVGGNRQLNRLLHLMAMMQVRNSNHAGSKYYERKRGEGKSARAAMRSLKRQLATVVYYRLRLVQARIDGQHTPIAA
jgi:transposase